MSNLSAMGPASIALSVIGFLSLSGRVRDRKLPTLTRCTLIMRSGYISAAQQGDNSSIAVQPVSVLSEGIQTYYERQQSTKLTLIKQRIMKVLVVACLALCGEIATNSTVLSLSPRLRVRRAHHHSKALDVYAIKDVNHGQGISTIMF